MNIENREEIVEQLAEMLIQFDKELNSAYQTDVYLYYDTDTETATLDTFVNVGGNSWLNDDHYTICVIPECYETIFERLNLDIAELADVLDVRKEELIKQTIDYHEYEDEWDITSQEVNDFIKNHSEYYDKLYNHYECCLNEHYSDYAEQAERIIDQFLKDTKK